MQFWCSGFFYFFFFSSPQLLISSHLFLHTHTQRTKRLREAAALTSNANMPPCSEQFLWAIKQCHSGSQHFFQVRSLTAYSSLGKGEPRCKGRRKVPLVAGSNRRVWLCRWVSQTACSTCLFQPRTGKCKQGKFLALIVRKGPAYNTTINSFPRMKSHQA